jgi:hypothetical protein
VSSTLRTKFHTCTAKKKKFKFQSLPETQNLFITVMLIEAAQYAKIEIAGLLVICDDKLEPLLGLMIDGGCWPDTAGILIL